ncbi:hypothetical protein [Novosphingobium naphthalenivorans]|uniref:hypothetical protein n=1 Tax=Novosphingobium naphthalenivorans TaxID=273168 RepID=UPI0012ED5FF4|nr:hypothetical protein [Novosphingobium naphthalenivorans]
MIKLSKFVNEVFRFMRLARSLRRNGRERFHKLTAWEIPSMEWMHGNSFKADNAKGTP